MTKALFIGKFQPFHKGHLAAIKHILTKHDFLTIIVGSSQEHDTEENPFSFETRHEMIQQSLFAEAVTNYEILPIPDCGSNDLWLESILDKRQDFQKVYTNNSRVQGIFQNAGYIVEHQPLFNRDQFEGTEIRKKIRNGEPWRHLVPPVLVPIIKRITIPKNIKRRKHRRCYH